MKIMPNHTFINKIKDFLLKLGKMWVSGMRDVPIPKSEAEYMYTCCSAFANDNPFRAMYRNTERILEKRIEEERKK